ncbi:hypothetical protein [Polaromonas sp.]|uniref:hypothetical protein n=1 Tax=Polaromonas sp. TaxID=1869339 RepID=UPI0032649111
MKTLILIEIDHDRGPQHGLVEATRSLVDSFLYRRGVFDVRVQEISGPPEVVGDTVTVQLRPASITRAKP